MADELIRVRLGHCPRVRVWPCGAVRFFMREQAHGLVCACVSASTRKGENGGCITEQHESISGTRREKALRVKVQVLG